MLSVSAYSGMAYQSLATINSQAPAGLAEAESLARQKQAQTISPLKSNDEGVATNQSRSQVRENQLLNSIASQRVPDLSGTNVQNRMSSSASTDSEEGATQDQQAKIDQVVNQLKARDLEVRAHEQAHQSVGGQYANGMSFSYQTGPDGKRYAIGGEVGIDSSAVPGDPEATIQKAMVIQSAAMAPAQPSSQDFRVAAAASQMMAEARAELSKQQTASEGSEGSSENEAGESGDADNSANRSQTRSLNSRDNDGDDRGVNRIAVSNDNDADDQTVMLPERMAFATRLQIPTGQEMVADLVNPG